MKTWPNKQVVASAPCSFHYSCLFHACGCVLPVLCHSCCCAISRPNVAYTRHPPPLSVRRHTQDISALLAARHVTFGHHMLWTVTQLRAACGGATASDHIHTFPFSIHNLFGAALARLNPCILLQRIANNFTLIFVHNPRHHVKRGFRQSQKKEELHRKHLPVFMLFHGMSPDTGISLSAMSPLW